MKEINLVKATEINTLEEYATVLLTSMGSLQTLGGYQASVLTKGILEEDEAKIVGYILDSIKALLNLYRSQTENILDRTETTEEEILKGLMKLMPEMEIPRKRRTTKKKEKKNEIPPVS
jgi:hypothetical protein